MRITVDMRDAEQVRRRLIPAAQHKAARLIGLHDFRSQRDVERADLVAVDDGDTRYILKAREGYRTALRLRAGLQ